MRLDYLTIFPDYLAPLRLSLPGKAIEGGLLELHVHDLRTWTHDRHRTVDDTPYGGGAGMVMKPEPFGEAFAELGVDAATTVVFTTPSGEPFTQSVARELSGAPRLVFACGRYEGIDQRVIDHARSIADVREISLGDYVLNGGEVAALAVTEAVVRLLPGFMGNAASLVEESHSEDGLLEYPVYTKPAVWEGREVPAVLLSGDHGKVAAWRRQQQLERTAVRRPDLLHASQAATTWEVAPAIRADAGEILTLQLACWVREAHAGDTLAGPALHEGPDEVAASLGTWDTYVVRSAGRLVGSVRARLLGPEWEIGRLMVAPDLRGRGLGWQLLEHIQRVAPAAATSYLLVTGTAGARNRRMYKRAGFGVYGPQPEDPGVRNLRKQRRS